MRGYVSIIFRFASLGPLLHIHKRLDGGFHVKEQKTMKECVAMEVHRRSILVFMVEEYL